MSLRSETWSLLEAKAFAPKNLRAYNHTSDVRKLSLSECTLNEYLIENINIVN